MTVVRFMQNPARLDRKLFAPGGREIEAVVASADAAIAEMAPAALAAIDAAIAVISRLAPDAADPEVQEAIYRQSNDIQGCAANFGLADLGEAAWSLCELIDSGGASSRAGPASVASHLDSLRLLRLGDAVEAEQRRAVLDGLTALRQHARVESA